MESHPGTKHSFDMVRLALMYMKMSLITGYPEEPLFNFHQKNQTAADYFSCCSYLVILLNCRVLLALKLAFTITNIYCQCLALCTFYSCFSQAISLNKQTHQNQTYMQAKVLLGKFHSYLQPSQVTGLLSKATLGHFIVSFTFFIFYFFHQLGI